jgi:hypothetical protein
MIDDDMPVKIFEDICYGYLLKGRVLFYDSNEMMCYLVKRLENKQYVITTDQENLISVKPRGIYYDPEKEMECFCLLGNEHQE